MRTETLDEMATRSNYAANRLRGAGVGSLVKLSRGAHERGMRLKNYRSNPNGYGVIVGFPSRWMVSVRPHGYRNPHDYHVRFWSVVQPRECHERSAR